MELLKPGTGLIFWQAVVFLGLFFILAKYAWKPILRALGDRERSIEDALTAAESARHEMASLKKENEALLQNARAERDQILKEAMDRATKLHEQAAEEARKNAAKIIQEARASIESEKQAALRDVRTQVAAFSLEIAEKLMKKNLAGDKAQTELAETYIRDLKLN